MWASSSVNRTSVPCGLRCAANRAPSLAPRWRLALASRPSATSPTTRRTASRAGAPPRSATDRETMLGLEERGPRCPLLGW